MGRTDYFDDPKAPTANSLVPATSAVVEDGRGRILLHLRADNGLWSIPGGGMEPGETVAECVIREVREETGVEVEPGRVIGIYSDPRRVSAYDDGEVRQEFSICLACRETGGSLDDGDDESDAVGWFTASEIRELDLTPGIRRRLDDYFRDDPAAAFS